MGKSVLIAGGGTGGHLFIGLAIAQAIRRLEPAATVYLVGCKAGFDDTLLQSSGFPTYIIAASPPSSPQAILRGTGSVFQAASLLGRLRPEVVAGSGGYGSVPPALASWLKRIPLLIHEPDAVMGKANRFIAKFAHTVTLGYEEAARGLPHNKCRATGNPVRENILKANREEARKGLGLAPESKLLFVLGGSQGARAINLAVAGAAQELLSIPGLQLLHTTGLRDIAEMKSLWQKLSTEEQSRYRLVEFLGEAKMGEALAAADLAITRGGAVSLAELAAWEVPSIIVPYPFATKAHQELNAQRMVNQGLATVVSSVALGPEIISAAVRERLENLPPRRLYPVNGSAADKIAEIILDLAK